LINLFEEPGLTYFGEPSSENTLRNIYIEKTNDVKGIIGK
jgi:hypothetical protein